MNRGWLSALRRSPAYRYAALPRRALVAVRHLAPDWARAARWLFASREETNFTFDLTEANLAHLAGILSAVSGASIADVRALIRELEEDGHLRAFIAETTKRSPWRAVSDQQARYGRRAAWYVLARLLKPRVVVETGVDKGFGAIILCAALLRNAKEGHPGRYYGTDINPDAGWLLRPPYSSAGEIRMAIRWRA